MASAQPSLGAVHPDTQGVLLLCASFPRRSGPDVKPLTPSEYNALATWLAQQNRRPASLVQAGADALPRDEPGTPSTERLLALLGRGFQLAAALESWQRLGLWVISRGESCYPERLRSQLRSAAPPLLYGAGPLDRLNQGGLAVVGSRNIDEEGLAFTRRVAEQCAKQGVPVVSGGARGVDRMAVKAALEAGGSAVAVLAERLDSAIAMRDAREALRDGRLTLATPYEPESGFTIGRLIGRNKLIYALADFALVVRFKSGEGGTWTGAIEQLRRNNSSLFGCPVFVRAAHNSQEGCEELQKRGAHLFPEEDLWTNNIVELLQRLTPPPAHSMDNHPVTKANAPTNDVPALPTESSQQTATQPDTCYHRCLPLLLECFRQEIATKGLPEIAQKLDLLPKQLENWLKRAVEDGKLAKKKRKGRVVYIAVSADSEQTLFDRDGDAA